MSAPQAIVAHDMDCRTRIRIPSRRGDMSFFANVRDKLSRCLDVERVETNPVTASVLIFHRGNFGAVEDFSRSHKLFDVAKRTDKPKLRPVTRSESLHQGLSVLQMFRTDWLPPAWTLLGEAFLKRRV